MACYQVFGIVRLKLGLKHQPGFALFEKTEINRMANSRAHAPTGNFKSLCTAAFRERPK